MVDPFDKKADNQTWLSAIDAVPQYFMEPSHVPGLKPHGSCMFVINHPGI